MTYEDKLEKIVSKLKDERDLTRKGFKTKITFNDESFTKVRIQDICKILLKLQDDEKALVILDAYLPLDFFDPYSGQKSDNYEKVAIIDIELAEAFDNWYLKYFIQQKSKPTNLDWLNLLKILDVCTDINQKLQITNNTLVSIQSFPYPYNDRFVELFPVDNIGSRKNYQQHRWEGTQYLLKVGVALEAECDNEDMLGYGNIVIRINPIKFDDFYKSIKDEVEKRKKSFDNTEEKTKTIHTTRGDLKTTYNAHRGELDIEGKIVKFKKESFRAKLLELLLKDDKSRKREWSWDEVIEEIEDTKDKEATTENKKRFYPACDGLSKHIALKTGVNDLLNFNKSTVQINSKYL